MNHMEVDFDIATYRRVLRLAETPDEEEFMKISTIAAAGIGLIGICGFIVFVMMNLLPV